MNVILFFILLVVYVANAFQFHSSMRRSSSTTQLYTQSDKLPSKPKIRSAEWARERGLEAGYGGIWPGDPNAPTHKVTVLSKKTGESFSINVPNDRYIFHVFEEAGIDLPVINKLKMCRQGCCTICCVKVLEGKVKMEAPLGLLKDMRDAGYALSCCSIPKSDVTCELQDEDFTYLKQWGEGFEGGGKEWGGFFLDED